ncbi:hypothetical protein ACHAWU_003459 [Discostella pseudostelligera]|uniref:Uncharacterized protein n=1 Tax=Discostella pseudostelligera TaxID=259834 RepID=A0ABD3M0W6_9STRA
MAMLFLRVISTIGGSSSSTAGNIHQRNAIFVFGVCLFFHFRSSTPHADDEPHRAPIEYDGYDVATSPPSQFHHLHLLVEFIKYHYNEEIIIITTTTTCLRMNFSPPDNTDIGGLNNGKYLLLIVLSACIWIFSIPPEFRRARFCTDEDVRLYPEKHCTTFNAWKTGIAEYYANGGGVHFDFSIEGK